VGVRVPLYARVAAAAAWMQRKGVSPFGGEREVSASQIVEHYTERGVKALEAEYNAGRPFPRVKRLPMGPPRKVRRNGKGES
jgi:hypothetical protein